MSDKRVKMIRETLAIKQDFIEQCTELLHEFGAARYDSFTRFIEQMLEIPMDCAEEIVERMSIRNDIYISSYADTPVVKLSSKNRIVQKNLDAFDAYLCILSQELQEKNTHKAYANRASFPMDFTIYITTGRVYYMFVYDKFLAQKLDIYQRRQTDKAFDPVILIVFPVGTDIRKAIVPKIKSRHMFAAVKKSPNGLTVCQTTEITGEPS